MSVAATFQQTADSFAKEINQTLSNDELKEVYGLYKQVLHRRHRNVVLEIGLQCSVTQGHVHLNVSTKGLYLPI